MALQPPKRNELSTQARMREPNTLSAGRAWSCWLYPLASSAGAEMLAAGGEKQWLRGAGRKFDHPIEQTTGLQQLTSVRSPIDQFGVWIARVFLVEAAESVLKAGALSRCAGWMSVCGHRGGG